MESSSSNEEPYIDSFFLPEGILDSEDDDVNGAPSLQQLLGGGTLLGGGNEAITPADELMPSFLKASKVSWTAPPLLIPSETVDDVAGFYRGGSGIAADDLESRTSTHSPVIASQRSTHHHPAASSPTQASAPHRWDDPHIEEVRDCPSLEKDHEPPTSPPRPPVATLLHSTRTGNNAVEALLDTGSAIPPPGLKVSSSAGSPSCKKVAGSPTSVPHQRSARSGSKGGAARDTASKHQRVVSPTPPQPPLPPPPPLTPQRKEATKGSNRRQSYASVLLAEAKKEAARDGSIRNQNVSNASVPALPYATPPRLSSVVSNGSVERRHPQSMAPNAAALSSQADYSANSVATTAGSPSADRLVLTSGPGPDHQSTPSKAARQRHPRRQRKLKTVSGSNHRASDSFVENDSSDSQKPKRESITSESSSSSSSSLVSSGVEVDASTSSSHTDVEESQSKGEGHNLSNGYRSAKEESAAERGIAARIDCSDSKTAVDAASQPTDRSPVKSLSRVGVVSVAEMIAPFISAWEAVLPLVLGGVSFVGVVFAEAAKVLILFALGLAATCQYAAEEVRQGSSGAAASYVAFLLLPAGCDLMMASFSLPHFTPHFVSTVTVCQLCQQSSSRKPYTATPSGYFADDRLAEDVSHTVLRVARYSLLVAELYEGFSRGNMSYMIADATTRALLAFALALARSNLLLSPVGWTSASVQWLIACYVGRNFVVSVALVVIGMASVQLSRRVQQPTDVEGGGAPFVRRPTFGGDETRGGARSGPGKRPSFRL